MAIDRAGYHQTGYIIEKGCDATLRAAHDVQWLRDRVTELFGWPAEATGAIRSWDDVKLLEVTVGMLERWYVPGLLCIGDAAHMLIAPALQGTLRTAPLPLRVVDAVPMPAGLAAYLGGIGIRPEHAPDFARRAPAGAGRPSPTH